MYSPLQSRDVYKRQLLSCVVAIPQSAPVAPPPKPADGGPTLEVTMRFVEDKLNEVGPISYSAT